MTLATEKAKIDYQGVTPGYLSRHIAHIEDASRSLPAQLDSAWRLLSHMAGLQIGEDGDEILILEKQAEILGGDLALSGTDCGSSQRQVDEEEMQVILLAAKAVLAGEPLPK